MSEVLRGRAFDIGWESRADIDTCVHDWKLLRVEPYPGARVIEVQKCARCGSPRCESHNDSGSCIDRRHHDSVHIYPDGEFQPLGGILPTDRENGGADHV